MNDRISAFDGDESRISHAPTRVTACASNAVAVVEDDIVLRGAICEALHDAGLQPYAAATLPNARKLLGVIHPCVLVLDLRLDGEDGRALLAEMRREGVDVPVIVISADVAMLRDQPSRRRTLMLEKPFDLDDLVDAVLAAVVS